MCFDAGKAAGWTEKVRLDHIGFGVVCGDDGKRFKTRSGATIALTSLLDEAKVRMSDSLHARKAEGKTTLTDEEIDSAATKIGYGAVKYFDLKNSPTTNYIFSYDNMLATNGNTAVYLLFAYARTSSILRKAEEKGVDLKALGSRAGSIVKLQEDSERQLAFKLLQFGDTIKSVLKELGLNRLCEYLYDLSVDYTTFVTNCHVLNSPEFMESRIALCMATKETMQKCFELLGISPLERI
jgi:arginyl-tRNA synthetase